MEKGTPDSESYTTRSDLEYVCEILSMSAKHCLFFFFFFRKPAGLVGPGFRHIQNSQFQSSALNLLALSREEGNVI